MSKKLKLFLLLAVAVAALVAAGVVVASRDKDPAPSTAAPTQSEETTLPEAEESEAGQTDPDSSASDAARKNDVSKLLAATSDFMSNNQGKLPGGWANGQLLGGSSAPVELEYYTFVTVLVGARQAINADGIILVTKATCGEAGATVSGSGRSAAVQYMLSTGPECQAL